MSRRIGFVLLCAGLLAGIGQAAYADDERRGGPDRGDDRVDGRHGERGRDDRTPSRRHWVPEFDPAAAGAIAVLIGGGGLLVARRRSKV